MSVKDISSTGLKGILEVKLFAGTHVEIDLRNIGWVAGQVVRTDRGGTVGIRFARIIPSELTRNRISGSYGPAPVVTTAVLRPL